VALAGRSSDDDNAICVGTSGFVNNVRFSHIIWNQWGRGRIKDDVMCRRVR